MKVMMIFSKDITIQYTIHNTNITLSAYSKHYTIQTLHLVLTVNITQYRNYAKYNEYENDVRC